MIDPLIIAGGTILFGWLLGLLTTPVTDSFKARSQRKRYLGMFLVDLKLFRPRMINLCYGLTIEFGEFDHEFLAWHRASIETLGEDELIESGVDKQYLIKLVNLSPQ